MKVRASVKKRSADDKIVRRKGRIYIITGLLAAALSVLWYILIPGDSYIVGASMTAATIGYFVKRQFRREE